MSVPPYQSIVQKIVGDDVNVFSIVPEGYSPETYEPSPQDIQRLATAKLVVLNGNLPYEANIETTLRESNPDAVVVSLHDSLDPSEFLLLQHDHEHEESPVEGAESNQDEDHDDQEEGEGEHTEDGEEVEKQYDPHTWLSPKLVIKQLPAIVVALQQVDPDNTQRYVDNAVGVVNELEQLSADIQNELQRHWGRSFLVYHPAFGYFARDYALTQRFIEIEGKEPSPTEIKEVVELVKKEQISVVYLERQFATRTAETLAEELNVPVEYVNPLSTDYFGSLRTFTNQLVSHF